MNPIPTETPGSYAPPAAYTPPSLPRSTTVFQNIRAAVGQVFVGQDDVLYQVLAALLAGGHVLLEGKPGLGKTHLVLAIARTFGGSFRRIQFTPDLMPSDVCGHTLFDMSSSTFRVRRGPVFANLLLADEINRAPAKTQSALLEVMQEAQVTIDGESHTLAPPFMTFATQNPIEQEGTYPLPEAQLDRFLLKVLIDYPDTLNETWVVKAVSSRASGGGLSPADVQQVCTPQDIIAAQEEAAAVQAVDQVVDYAVSIVRATRQHSAISLGAGTRGAISLVRVAKSYALLEGRSYITPSDVKRAVLPVLRHRVQLAPEIAISGQTVDDMLASLLKTIEAPRV
ncbi:MAG: MoxR family ATPase [Prosthecobacter sp.]|jgi:MoxR-like ATPase|uniref:AAA family ATPase n=1 Tax=Prosthecobacter sp. TaxID=1965333 RepID=UPI0019F6461E|nr:MoxR family ATPase [Prosthecobacter sp.]MBE2285361.1 MoxR family ATPase [Prosthecobacter sp.]